MSTQRLPIPNHDDGTWGDILNGFLGVAHNPDGTLKQTPVVTVNSKTGPTVTLAAGDVGAEPAGLSSATDTVLANTYALRSRTGSRAVGQDEDVINVRDHYTSGMTDTQCIAAAETYRATNHLAQRLYIPGGLGSGTNGEWMMDPGGATAVSFTSSAVGLLGDSGATVVKVINSAGDYASVFSYTGSSGSFFNVEGILFDGNSANNPVSAALPTNQKRIGLYVPSGSKLRVRHCDFQNFNGTWVVVLNGSETSVTDCFFDNIGANAPSPIDTSSLYMQAADMFVHGVEFAGGGPNARTAMELHGPNQMVSDILVKDYWAVGNIVAGTAGTSGMFWHNIRGTGLGTGVQLWSTAATSPVSSTYGLENVVVDGDFEIDYDKWVTQFPANHRVGYSLAGSSDLPIRNIKLSGHIRYKAFTSVPSTSDAGSFGVNFTRSNTISGTDQTIDLSGLKISGSPAGGVNMQLKNTVTSGLNLSGVQVTNPGTGNSPNFSTAYMTGALLAGAFQDTNFDRFLLLDNQLTHTAVSATNTQSVTVATNCRAYDCSMDITDGSYVPMMLGSTTSGAAFDVRYRHPAYATPTGLFIVGSTITDQNGVQHIQTSLAAGGGSTWTSVTAGASTGNNRPSQNNLLAWPADPITATGTSALSNVGVATVLRMTMDATSAITSVMLNISAAASGLTSAGIAIYDTGGTRLGLTGDLSSTLNGATGQLTISLTTPTAAQTLGNDVLVLIFVNGTTAPTLRGWGSAQLTSIGRTNTTSRFSTYSTGLTSTPSPLVVASLANTSAQVALFLK